MNRSRRDRGKNKTKANIHQARTKFVFLVARVGKRREGGKCKGRWGHRATRRGLMGKLETGTSDQIAKHPHQQRHWRSATPGQKHGSWHQTWGWTLELVRTAEVRPQQLGLESQSTHRSGQKGWQQPSHNPDAVSRGGQGTIGLIHLPLDRKSPPPSHPPILYLIPGKPNKETYIVNIESKWMWTTFRSRPEWGPWAGKLKQREFQEADLEMKASLTILTGFGCAPTCYPWLGPWKGWNQSSKIHTARSWLRKPPLILTFFTNLFSRGLDHQACT